MNESRELKNAEQLEELLLLTEEIQEELEQKDQLIVELKTQLNESLNLNEKLNKENSLSYSPAKSKNYMLYCNGNFIGGLFDEELCFVYADSVSMCISILYGATCLVSVRKS